MKTFIIYIALAVSGIVFAAQLIEKEQNNSNEIILSEGNTLALSDEVNESSVGDVLSELKNIKKSKDCVAYLYLKTPGGGIVAGQDLTDSLKASGCEIKTITSFAASMGFQIVQHLGERLILQSGTLMSHHATGQFQGEFGGQYPSQVENRHNFWKARIEALDQITVDRTKGKQTLASYQKAYENELWLTAQQAIDQGYADRIVKVRCDKSLDGVNTKTTQFFGMDVSYDIDKCPLNSAPKNIRMKLETTRGIMDSREFVKQGGMFGVGCLLMNDPNKLCVLDTTINLSKLEEVKQKFINNYTEKQNKVIEMY